MLRGFTQLMLFLEVVGWSGFLSEFSIDLPPISSDGLDLLECLNLFKVSWNSFKSPNLKVIPRNGNLKQFC